ncbi:hypothetical protein Goarm_012744, partial [Gossypium armourianum]|nr:hypothetical protein [Gossypium armourianum]
MEEVEAYGPWMVVERKNWCNLKEKPGILAKKAGLGTVGTRFDALIPGDKNTTNLGSLGQANKLNHGMGFGAAERKVSAEASLGLSQIEQQAVALGKQPSSFVELNVEGSMVGQLDSIQNDDFHVGPSAIAMKQNSILIHARLCTVTMEQKSITCNDNISLEKNHLSRIDPNSTTFSNSIFVRSYGMKVSVENGVLDS